MVHSLGWIFPARLAVYIFSHTAKSGIPAFDREISLLVRLLVVSEMNQFMVGLEVRLGTLYFMFTYCTLDRKRA